MDKIASHSIYKQKILLNFPMIFRPIISKLIDLGKPYILPNDYLNFLRALIVGEPTNTTKIIHPDFIKAHLKIRKEYKNDFFYIVAKIEEFSNTKSKFLAFLKKLNSSDITFK